MARKYPFEKFSKHNFIYQVQPLFSIQLYEKIGSLMQIFTNALFFMQRLPLKQYKEGIYVSFFIYHGDNISDFGNQPNMTKSWQKNSFFQRIHIKKD